MPKIFINPGHSPNGNPDPGACNVKLGLHECDIALQIGEKVKSYLEDAWYEVRLLQSDNLAGENPAQPNATAAANEWGADLLVSIHCNSFNSVARGIETLIYARGGESEMLAYHIQSQLVDALQAIDSKIPDRGIKERPGLAVLRASKMPAVLVETAFIDNEADVKLLIERQDDIARAIARGVSDYFA